MIESKNVVFFVTNDCNLRCPYCMNGDKVVTDQRELTAQEIISFLEKVPNLNSVTITGGEPLSPSTYEKTYEIVDYIKSRNAFMRIHTNGTCGLPPNFPYRSPKASFETSLDGTKEVHESIRGIGTYDKTVSFIRDRVSEGFKMSVMRVITEEPDYFELDRYINFTKSLGLSNTSMVGRRNGGVIIRPVHPAGRASDSKIINIDLEALERFVRARGADFRMPKGKCLGYKIGSIVYFDEYGNIIPCTILKNHKFGTIFDYDEPKVKAEMEVRIGNITCVYPNGIPASIDFNAKF